MCSIYIFLEFVFEWYSNILYFNFLAVVLHVQHIAFVIFLVVFNVFTAVVVVLFFMFLVMFFLHLIK